MENGQSKFVYSDDGELISRGTTVLVKRVPLPHGVKKTWRQERAEVQNRAELSNLEVTSTSEVTMLTVSPAIVIRLGATHSGTSVTNLPAHVTVITVVFSHR